MYFIKSAISFLFALAILGSSGLADTRVFPEHTGNTETAQLVAGDLITGVSILPATTPTSTPGYKIIDSPFTSKAFLLGNTSWIINPSNFYPYVNSITRYSLLIIHAFHSFW